MPKRIQLRRAKGWRIPEGAVHVARPGRWGNPFKIEDYKDVRERRRVVDQFELWTQGTEKGRALAAEARVELRGKDLACWCPVGQPCHADVLLELANA